MRDAVARKVPVIGHCLGGQMLARALGADGLSARLREHVRLARTFATWPIRAAPSFSSGAARRATS